MTSKRLFLPILILIFSFSFFTTSFAKVDLAINVSNITFSEEPLDGERVRLFARVLNIGDEDVYGFVVFSSESKELTEPQPISVKAGTYDDVFIDWIFKTGNYDIEAKIVSTWPQDETLENNSALKQDYFVDLDSDGDGIGDSKDNDNDNDNLSNEKEAAMGTSPFRADTDGDAVLDSEDSFPLDPEEWQDNDQDGIGDNEDIDDDNDGLTDQEEVFIYRTDPLNIDTDGDKISDKKETELKIGFLKPDRNEWDMAFKGLASMVAAVKLAVESGNITVGRLFAAFGFCSIIFLILNYKNKRPKRSGRA